MTLPFLDLRLPDTDGLELMEELHQHQSNLPVIATHGTWMHPQCRPSDEKRGLWIFNQTV
ncbi:MAG: hypothetical protein R3B83_10265 [Nitrospirales bacterium]|nr:response regulator [Nitrospirales bacterium]